MSSKGYEKFQKVDIELVKLLLYIEKLEEEHAQAISDCDKNFRNYERYKKAYNIMQEYFDCIPGDERESVDRKLRNLEL